MHEDSNETTSPYRPHPEYETEYSDDVTNLRSTTEDDWIPHWHRTRLNETNEPQSSSAWVLAVESVPRHPIFGGVVRCVRVVIRHSDDDDGVEGVSEVSIAV